MSSKTEHCDDDSDVSDEDFPPFVEPVRSARVPGSGGLSGTDIQRDFRSPQVLGTTSGESVAQRTLAPSKPLLEQLGSWRISREIGRGGMGVVYEAVHVDTQQHAALKLLPFTGGLDPRRLDRFRHEAEIVERLAHPNIVRLLSIEHQGNHHFLVMQLVHGISLDRVVGSISTHNTSTTKPQQNQTGSEENLQCKTEQTGDLEGAWVNEKLFGQRRDRFRYIASLVQQAAQALSYAHSQRIIHRDIKPSNLLVDQNDTLWITDFGLAQIQGEQGLTATGDLLGTLRYMSPEQAMASRIPVDHRTDVYSLGATLYELLCGRAAFQADDRKELLRQVLFDEPAALKKIDVTTPLPLQIIVEKAMRKDPRQRYSTAGEMADDLFRFLNDSPIHARPLPAWEPALRWFRRNRALAISLVTVMTLLVLLGAGRLIYLELQQQHQDTVLLLERTADAEKESKAFARLREVSRYRQTGLSGLRDRLGLLDVDATGLPDLARSELRNEWLSCMARADWSFTKSILCESPVAAISPSGKLIAELADPSDQETLRIRKIDDPSSFIVCDHARLKVKAVWFSRGGEYLVATDLASYWQIFLAENGRKVFELPQLAAGCDICDETRQVVFWHATSVIMVGSMAGDMASPELQTFAIDAPAAFVRFSPDGSQLAILLWQRSVRMSLIDSRDGKLIRSQPGGTANVLAWSPDGTLIALPNQNGKLIIHSAESARTVATLDTNESVISGITWHPSGNYLITTSWTGETLLRHVWTGRVVVRSHEALDAVSFSDDGRQVGWQLKNQVLRLAEWEPGHVIDLPWDANNNTNLPAGISFHPQVSMAAVHSLYGLQLFDLSTGTALQRNSYPGMLSAEFTKAGDELIALTRTALIRWPIQRSTPREIRIGLPQVIPVPFVESGLIMPGGLTAVVRLESSTDQLTKLQTSDGSFIKTFGDSAPGLDVAQVGPFIVRRGWRADRAEIFESESSQKLAELRVGMAATVSASTNSSHFVSSSLEQLEFWNPSTWERTNVLALDAPVVGANAAFHPNSQILAIRLMPNRLGLIDAENRLVIARIDELDASWTTANAFSPDGRYFVELSGDPSGVRVWDLAQMRRTLAGKHLDWSDESGVDDSPGTEGTLTSVESNSIDLSETASRLKVTMEAKVPLQRSVEDELNAAKAELAAHSDDPRLQNQVAWRLLMAPIELRDNVEALRLARLASAGNPESSAVRNTLGLACYRNGLYSEAEQLLMMNLRSSGQEVLTLDLIILSMVAAANKQSNASETYHAWAEKNLADHPPIDDLTDGDVRTLRQERAMLVKGAK